MRRHHELSGNNGIKIDAWNENLLFLFLVIILFLGERDEVLLLLLLSLASRHGCCKTREAKVESWLEGSGWCSSRVKTRGRALAVSMEGLEDVKYPKKNFRVE